LRSLILAVSIVYRYFFLLSGKRYYFNIIARKNKELRC
jgi:hypothetical protein